MLPSFLPPLEEGTTVQQPNENQTTGYWPITGLYLTNILHRLSDVNKVVMKVLLVQNVVDLKNFKYEKKESVL